MNNCKLLFNTLLIILMTISFSAWSQKQPQIQEISVRAPANIKIDGKLNEWQNQYLNAYRSASRIYYVVSNDDKNLYLTMRGLGTGVAIKALRNGIVFTISHSVKRNRAKAPGNVWVEFPMPQDAKAVADVMGPILSAKPFLDDSVTYRKQIDSIVSISDSRVNNIVKEMKVDGIKEITDTVISIYNTQGIKAAIQFIKRQPVIELAIPLKYLGLSVSNPTPFSYNIRLNGPPQEKNPDLEDDDPDLSKSMPAGNDALFGISTTDFWGIYTLAVK
jgi:hypothetical protein